MGVDALDLVFRIEKAFEIKLSKQEFLSLVKDQDVVVGDLYDLVLAKLQLCDVGRNDFGLNFRLWAEMQAVLERVSGVKLDEIVFKCRSSGCFRGRRAASNGIRCVKPVLIALANSTIRFSCGLADFCWRLRSRSSSKLVCGKSV